jgi:CPA2 family monovalent cation:H+ antiporter-2
MIHLAVAMPAILVDVTIILGLAMIVVLLSNYFKIPTILGLLITGIVAGPEALSLIKSMKNINIFADIGVVLLLFSIGIEISLKNLYRIRKQVFLGGTLQMLLTVAFTLILGFFTNLGFKTNLLLGLMFSLSSTAIVLKILQSTSKLNSAQGKSTLAILIFQDIIVIPLMLLLPYLGDTTSGSWSSLFSTLLMGVITVVLTIVLARVAMPKFLFLVAKSKSSELFLLSVLVICMAIAGFTAYIGLSLSLGAFLAGLIISESEYSHEAFGTILPFRELFTSFFFISIGLLVNVSFFISHISIILLITAAVLILKTIGTTIASYYTGHNLRVAFITGIFLSQVGEFSFILLNEALKYNLLNQEIYQTFLSVSILSMALTPSILQHGERLAGYLGNLLMSDQLKKRFPRLIKSSRDIYTVEKKLSDHIIMIGYGNGGKSISKALRMASIPFLAIDSDPEIVLAAKSKKTPVIFGSATNKSVLEHAYIKDARVIIITVSEYDIVKNIILEVRKLNQNVYIITVTNKLQDAVKLFDIGANDVISEQFETSMEIVARALAKYLVPRNQIDEFIYKIRELNYSMMRSIRYEQQGIQDYRLEISETEITTVRVRAEMPFCYKLLSEANIRIKYGINILALKRGANIIANPDGQVQLLPGDLLVVFGSHQNIDEFLRL